MVLVSRGPLRARSAAYSSVVRSRPPTLTSISRSAYRTSSSRHRPTAIRQDGDRLIVLPVVNDVAQDVGAAAGGHRVEEAPSDELAAVDDADLLGDLPSGLDDVGLVEEDATQARVPLEDRR